MSDPTQSPTMTKRQNVSALIREALAALPGGSTPDVVAWLKATHNVDTSVSRVSALRSQNAARDRDHATKPSKVVGQLIEQVARLVAAYGKDAVVAAVDLTDQTQKVAALIKPATPSS